MGEIGTAFVRIRPNMAGFKGETERGVKGAFAGIGKVVGVTFAVAGVAEAASAVTKAAADQEAELSVVRQAVKATNAEWVLHGQTVTQILEKQARDTGFTVAELGRAFNRVQAATQDTATSFKILTAAEDVARSQHRTTQVAALALVRAYQGSSQSLRRFGLVIAPVTAEQDKLTKAHLAAVAAGVKFSASNNAVYKSALTAAKAADKQATSQHVLNEALRRFGGQAGVFAQTAAGQFARLHETINQFEVALGEHVLPTLGDAADGLRKFFNELRTNKQAQEDAGLAAGALATGFHAVKDVAHAIAPPLQAIASAAHAITKAVGGTEILVFAAGFKTLSISLGLVSAARGRYEAVLARGTAASAADRASLSASTAALTQQTAALNANSAAQIRNTNLVKVGGYVASEQALARRAATAAQAEQRTGNLLFTGQPAFGGTKRAPATLIRSATTGETLTSTAALTAAIEKQKKAVLTNAAAADVWAGKLRVTSQAAREGGLAIATADGAVVASTAQVEARFAGLGAKTAALNRGLFAMAGGWKTIAAIGIGAIAFGVYKLVTATDQLEAATNRALDAQKRLDTELQRQVDIRKKIADLKLTVPEDKSALFHAQEDVKRTAAALRSSTAGQGTQAFRDLQQGLVDALLARDRASKRLVADEDDLAKAQANQAASRHKETAAVNDHVDALKQLATASRNATLSAGLAGGGPFARLAPTGLDKQKAELAASKKFADEVEHFSKTEKNSIVRRNEELIALLARQTGTIPGAAQRAAIFRNTAKNASLGGIQFGLDAKRSRRDGRDVGLAASQGIASGVGDGSHLVSKAAARAAAAAIQGAKQALGIKSPSQVMREEVGWAIASGISLGIADRGQSVARAMAKVLSDAIDHAFSTAHAKVTRRSKELADALFPVRPVAAPKVASPRVARAYGGVIGGVGNKDSEPAMLTPGEVVLNAPQQQHLMGRLGIQGGPHDLFRAARGFATGGVARKPPPPESTGETEVLVSGLRARGYRDTDELRAFAGAYASAHDRSRPGEPIAAVAPAMAAFLRSRGFIHRFAEGGVVGGPSIGPRAQPLRKDKRPLFQDHPYYQGQKPYVVPHRLPTRHLLYKRPSVQKESNEDIAFEQLLRGTGRGPQLGSELAQAPKLSRGLTIPAQIIGSFLPGVAAAQDLEGGHRLRAAIDAGLFLPPAAVFRGALGVARAVRGVEDAAQAAKLAKISSLAESGSTVGERQAAAAALKRLGPVRRTSPVKDFARRIGARLVEQRGSIPIGPRLGPERQSNVQELNSNLAFLFEAREELRRSGHSTSVVEGHIDLMVKAIIEEQAAQRAHESKNFYSQLHRFRSERGSTEPFFGALNIGSRLGRSFTKEQVRAAYAAEGNVRKAGKQLGISHSTMTRLLDAHGIPRRGPGRPWGKRNPALPPETRDEELARLISEQAADDRRTEIGSHTSLDKRLPAGMTLGDLLDSTGQLHDAGPRGFQSRGVRQTVSSAAEAAKRAMKDERGSTEPFFGALNAGKKKPKAKPGSVFRARTSGGAKVDEMGNLLSEWDPALAAREWDLGSGFGEDGLFWVSAYLDKKRSKVYTSLYGHNEISDYLEEPMDPSYQYSARANANGEVESLTGGGPWFRQGESKGADASVVRRFIESKLARAKALSRQREKVASGPGYMLVDRKGGELAGPFKSLQQAAEARKLWGGKLMSPRARRLAARLKEERGSTVPGFGIPDLIAKVFQNKISHPGVAASVDEALAMIAAKHGLPASMSGARIPIMLNDPTGKFPLQRGSRGQLITSYSGRLKGIPRHLALTPKQIHLTEGFARGHTRLGRDPEAAIETTIHEMAHALDASLFKVGPAAHQFGSSLTGRYHRDVSPAKGKGPLVDVMRALHGTPTVARIAEKKIWRGDSLEGLVEADWAKYLFNPTEMFARAYTQEIHGRAPSMWRPNSYESGDQFWPKKEFRPVSSAFKRLFETLKSEMGEFNPFAFKGKRAKFRRPQEVSPDDAYGHHGEIAGWPSNARSLAEEMLETHEQFGGDDLTKLLALRHTISGRLGALGMYSLPGDYVEEGGPFMSVEYLASEGKTGAGTHLAQVMAKRAARTGLGVSFGATSHAKPYYQERLGLGTRFNSSRSSTYFQIPHRPLVGLLAQAKRLAKEERGEFNLAGFKRPPYEKQSNWQRGYFSWDRGGRSLGNPEQSATSTLRKYLRDDKKTLEDLRAQETRSAKARRKGKYGITARRERLEGSIAGLEHELELRSGEPYDQMKKRVKIRQTGGDDGYHWGLFEDGKLRRSGMTKREAEYSQRQRIEALIEGGPLSPKDQTKVANMEALVRDPGATPGEKDAARAGIQRLRAKAKKLGARLSDERGSINFGAFTGGPFPFLARNKAGGAALEAAAMQAEQGGMSAEAAARMFNVSAKDLRAHIGSGAHAREQARILSNADVGSGPAITPHSVIKRLFGEERGSTEPFFGAANFPIGLGSGGRIPGLLYPYVHLSRARRNKIVEDYEQETGVTDFTRARPGGPLYAPLHIHEALAEIGHFPVTALTARGRIRGAAGWLPSKEGADLSIIGSDIRGGGTALMAAIAREALKAKTDDPVIEVSPARSAVGFYEKLGFVQRSRDRWGQMPGARQRGPYTKSWNWDLRGDALRRLAERFKDERGSIEPFFGIGRHGERAAGDYATKGGTFNPERARLAVRAAHLDPLMKTKAAPVTVGTLKPGERFRTWWEPRDRPREPATFEVIDHALGNPEQAEMYPDLLPDWYSRVRPISENAKKLYGEETLYSPAAHVERVVPRIGVGGIRVARQAQMSADIEALMSEIGGGMFTPGGGSRSAFFRAPEKTRKSKVRGFLTSAWRQAKSERGEFDASGFSGKPFDWVGPRGERAAEDYADKGGTFKAASARKAVQQARGEHQVRTRMRMELSRVPVGAKFKFGPLEYEMLQHNIKASSAHEEGGNYAHIKAVTRAGRAMWPGDRVLPESKIVDAFPDVRMSGTFQRMAQFASLGAAKAGGHKEFVGMTPAEKKKWLLELQSLWHHRFATGGVAQGASSGDSVRAMLTPGEIVLNRDQQQGLAERLGVAKGSPKKLFDAIRGQRFSAGGVVDAGNPLPQGVTFGQTGFGIAVPGAGIVKIRLVPPGQGNVNDTKTRTSNDAGAIGSAAAAAYLAPLDAAIAATKLKISTLSHEDLSAKNLGYAIGDGVKYGILAKNGDVINAVTNQVQDAVKVGVKNIQDSILSAKGNLISLGAKLSSDIGNILDKRREAGLGAPPTGILGQRLKELMARVHAGTADTRTIKLAQEIQDQLAAKAAAASQDQSKDKDRITRRVADLVDLVDKGKIGTKTFDKDIGAVLKKAGVSPANVQQKLGIAAADQLRSEIKGVHDQAVALRATPNANFGGAGFSQTIVRPLDAIKQEQKNVANAAKQQRDEQIQEARKLLEEQKRHRKILEKIHGQQVAAAATPRQSTIDLAKKFGLSPQEVTAALKRAGTKSRYNHGPD